MEAFNIADELQQWAEAKGWIFLLGDQFYANIEADREFSVGQPVLWCNLEANENRAIGNRVDRINYTGLLGLGIKFDDNYTIEDDPLTNANLDETFKQKYDRRLKELLQLLSDEMKKFTCSNNLQILSSSYVYDINKFDTNIDFVIGTFDIEQESFTVVPNEVDLTLTAEPGGIVEPYEGTQTQSKYSSVPINAVPDANYAFKEWIIDGVKVLDKLTSVFMNRAKIAIAYFESSLEVIQDVFGTKPIDNKFIDNVGLNNVDIENVQVLSFNNDINIRRLLDASDTLESYETTFYIPNDITPLSDFEPLVDFTNANQIIDLGAATGGLTDELITYANGSHRVAYTNAVGLIQAGWHTVKLEWNDSDSNYRLFLDEVRVDNAYTGTPIKGTVFNFNVGKQSTFKKFTGHIHSSILRTTDDANSHDWCLQEGADLEIIDSYGNNNDGLIQGTSTTKWDNFATDLKVVSKLIENGYTLFQQIADPNIFYRAIYDDNGIQTVISKTGYVKFDEIQKNVVSDSGCTYGNIQIPDVNTFTEIAELEDSETVEITKGNNFDNTVNVIVLGNSLTQRYPGNQWTDILSSELQTLYPNLKIEVQNSGVSGSTTLEMLQNYQSRVRDKIRQGAKNILIINEFVNDYSQYTPEVANGYMQDIYNLAVLDNFDGVFMTTAPQMTIDNGIQSWSDSANNILRNETYYSVFIDIRDANGMDDYTDLTYRDADGIHLNDDTIAGRQAFSDAVKPELIVFIDGLVFSDSGIVTYVSNLKVKG